MSLENEFRQTIHSLAVEKCQKKYKDAKYIPPSYLKKLVDPIFNCLWENTNGVEEFKIILLYLK